MASCRPCERKKRRTVTRKYTACSQTATLSSTIRSWPTICGGSRKGSPWTPGSVAPPVGEQMLIAPVNGLDLDFGQNAVGDAATSTVLFRGENLQTDIAVAIIPYSRGSNDAEREQYKKMASMFTIDVETLSKANINSPSGVYLRVTYTPYGGGRPSCQTFNRR